MFPYLNPQTGFVRTILIILVAILVLSYFGIDLRGIIASDTGQSNFSYIKEVVVYIWREYLTRPIMFLWNDVFIGVIWETFIGAMENIKKGKPTDLEQGGPNVDLVNPSPQSP